MDLDDELRRLFKDDRLTMKVAPDAETHVVAGARRMRRRRTVMMSAAGVLSAVVLAGGALLITQPAPESNQPATQPPNLPIDSTGVTPTEASETPPVTAPRLSDTNAPVKTTSDPPAASPGTSKPAANVPAPPSEPLLTVGPAGAGRIRLGMTTADLTASGQAHPSTKSVSGCSSFTVRAGSGTVWAARNGTVVALVYQSGVVTPERIAIDTPQDAVQAAYPDLTGTTAKVPGNPDAKYRFTFSAGKVTSIALLASQQDCVG